MSYRLTCECGRAYPIESRQSGQTFQCECGKTLQIPTMLKMKRLPVWEESDSASVSESSEPSKSEELETKSPKESASKESSPKESASENSASPVRANKLSSKRLGLLIVASIVLVVSTYFFCRNIPQPSPRAVFYKQTTFSLDDGKKVKRDSTPITESDFYFYYFTDFSAPNKPTYPVNDELIDAMVPFIAYQYFNYVRDLNLSDNFYENYDAIKTKRVLNLCEFGILALLALAAALYALFAKESNKQVGTMRGSDWR